MFTCDKVLGFRATKTVPDAGVLISCCMSCRNDKYVMAYQQQQLSMWQRVLPSAKKVPGGVKGRLCMTLQDGAPTPDILTGILQVSCNSVSTDCCFPMGSCAS